MALISFPRQVIDPVIAIFIVPRPAKGMGQEPWQLKYMDMFLEPR